MTRLGFGLFLSVTEIGSILAAGTKIKIRVPTLVTSPRIFFFGVIVNLLMVPFDCV